LAPERGEKKEREEETRWKKGKEKELKASGSAPPFALSIFSPSFRFRRQDRKKKKEKKKRGGRGGKKNAFGEKGDRETL